MTRTCPKCGLENEEERDFCARPGCGGYLRAEQTRFVPAVRRGDPAPAASLPAGEPAARAAAPPPAPTPPRTTDRARHRAPLPAADPAPDADAPRSRAREGSPSDDEPHGAEPPPPGHETLVAPARPVERPTALLAFRREGEDGSSSEPLQLTVEAGAEATAVVLVRNQDAIVDNYDVRVTGLPDGWWTVTPATTHLLPFSSGGDYEAEVQVRLHPPRAPEAEAKAWPLRIVAVSRAHERPAASLPFMLEIAPFQALTATVVPERAAGRRRARFELGVHNLGNAPAAVTVAGEDEQASLRYDVASPRLSAAAGERAATAVRVRPPRRLWFGRPADRPFTLLAHAPGADPLRARAVFRQRPLIPLWTLLLVPLLVVAAVVAYLLWFNRVAVPELAGRTRFQASQILKREGLELGRVSSGPARGRKPGTVIGQEVEAGEKLGKGATVGIQLAVGRGDAEVPDVVGRSLPDADALLSAKGFVATVQGSQDDPLRALVRRQVPVAGERLGKDRPVTLYVVTPPEKPSGDTTKLPAGVVGATAAVALAALVDAGVRPVTERAFSATVPAGTVISQAPPEGGEVEGEGPVRLIVSAGFPRIALDDGRSLIVAPGAGEGRTRRLPGEPGAENTQPSWSPEGGFIAFRRGDDAAGRIFRATPTLGGVRPLTDSGHDDRRPAVSPDGREVAFIREPADEDGSASELCLTSAAGGGKPACLDAGGLVGRPAWAPDGRTLVVLAPDDQGQIELLAFRRRMPSSSRWRRAGLITDGVGHGDLAGDEVASAAYAPAGPPRLAVLANWEARNTGAYRLFLGPVDARGVPQELAPVGRLLGCEVAWRSDGKALALAAHAGCDTGTSGEVRVVELDGPEPRPLAVFGANPAWEPIALEP